MPTLRFAKSALGPIVEVTLRPSAVGLRELLANGREDPGSVTVKMLIDSGSSHTFIDEDVVQRWNLPHVGFGWGKTLAGTKPLRSYDLDMELHGRENSERWTVTSLNASARQESFEGMPYSGLLGRDVLDHAVFVYDGPGHECTLIFNDGLSKSDAS